jgi:hypothetical protein
MSAGTHSYVTCDNLDKDAPAGQRACKEQVEARGSRADARRAAKKLGWTVNVHANSLRPYPRSGGLGFDYCPAHKPTEEPAQ